MRSDVILAGNAITASILEGYLLDDERYQLVGTVVDDAFADDCGLESVPNLGLSELPNKFDPQTVRVILAVGYGNLNKNREAIATKILDLGFEVISFIHPDAKILTTEPIGGGTVILPNAVIEPHAKVGANAMIWCNTTIGHHSAIGANSWIASGTVVAGHAKVGKNSFIGVNVTIANQVSVGDFNIIGAGALVSKDTNESTVHLARSAEPIRYTAEDYARVFLK